MDALSEALLGVRVTGALLFNAEFTAPWGYASPSVDTAGPLLSAGSERLVLFHLVTEGQATVRVAGHEDLQLDAGDIVVLPYGDAHRFWNGPVLQMVETQGLLPRILGGALNLERGGGGGEPTTFVCGYFGCERYAEQLFLAGLPPVFKVSIRNDPAGRWLEDSIRHAVAETASGRAGRSAMLGKLVEALFIETLCRYMDGLPPEETGWLAAARDAAVGTTLASMHRDPARAWTVADLAAEAGVSRTVLIERFSRYLGEPPLAYLGRWRLQLAARLLETTDRNVIEVALDAGYESEAAFNRAFKRQFELPPARYRRRHREEQSAA